jgi:hypothetical protein
MSLSYIFNKASGEKIHIFLATSGPDFLGVTGTISEAAKGLALGDTKATFAFEGGKLFKDGYVKKIESLRVMYVAFERFPLGSSCQYKADTGHMRAKMI